MNVLGRSRVPLLSVTYDDDLADRVRELIYPAAGLAEKKMFGGLAFLIGGNMAIAVSGQGACSFVWIRERVTSWSTPPLQSSW